MGALMGALMDALMGALMGASAVAILTTWALDGKMTTALVLKS